jgi:putative colanic acid biosynthesis acetyltransferase WcaF
MTSNLLKTYSQASPYDTPWKFRDRLRIIIWNCCWFIFCRWTPKPFNPWRLMWLKLFGATIEGIPFVHQRARIAIPWNITLYDRACLGDRTNAYSLGEIEIGARATVAQEAYLCTGTHDFGDPALPLLTGKITIGEDAFIGARAFIQPGVNIGRGTVIGACSVVTRDMPDGMVCVGHPCKPLKPRRKSGE